jgi:pimeloyl-ACP methyl ester carboxylesterase
MPTLHVHGADLFHCEAGPLSAPPVLLVHGTGMNADAWGEVFDRLAEDRRVIAYDRRGHTRSDGPPAADWSRHADDAAALLRALEAAPATVAGWSAGAIIAVNLALRHPDVVSSLVLLEPGLYGRQNLRFQLLRLAGRPERAVDDLNRHLGSYRCGGSVWDDPDYSEERRIVERGNVAAIAEELKARNARLSPEALQDLDVPTTVAVGDQSPPSFERCARATARAIAGAQLHTVRGMTHTISFGHSHEVAALIRGGE